MTRKTATLAASAGTAMACALAHAGGPIIDIPPGTLPSEAWFAVNPDATVNVSSGEFIFPDDGAGGSFEFNGATVNIESTAASGFFTLDHFVQDVTFNINGGDLIRANFQGLVGTSTLNINSGSVERGLHLRGNSTAVMSGGSVGLVAQGQAAFVLEDTATFTMSDGTIDTFILITESTVFTQTGGTLSGGILAEDDAAIVVSGGSSGRDGRLRDIGCTLTVSGGTIGRDFVAEHGVVTMTGGGFETNCGMTNGGGVDPVWNMSGGALGESFRAYDGTINISGGLVGLGFRLGRPTGDGSGVTCNLTVKSAMIDGVALDLTRTPAVITTRGGAFLSCVLLDDSLIGFHLNEDSVFGEDRIRAAATLTVALAPCPADIAAPFGDPNFFDVSAYIGLYTAMDPAADLAAPFGVFNFFDVVEYIAQFNAGCP